MQHHVTLWNPSCSRGTQISHMRRRFGCVFCRWVQCYGGACANIGACTATCWPTSPRTCSARAAPSSKRTANSTASRDLTPANRSRCTSTSASADTDCLCHAHNFLRSTDTLPSLCRKNWTFSTTLAFMLFCLWQPFAWRSLQLYLEKINI